MRIVLRIPIVLLLLTCRSFSLIKSASEPDYAPFCISTEFGTADGFSVELLKKTLSIMGEDVSIPVGEWKKIKKDLEIGEIEVLPLVGRTPEREKVFDFTFPYISMYGTIIVRDFDNEIKKLKDLQNKSVLVLEGDNAHEFIVRNKITENIVLTSSFKNALKRLSAGESDAVVMQRLLAHKIISSENIKNLKSVAYPLKEFRQDFCFAVKEGNKELLALLNEGLAILKANGEFERIYYRWFSEIEKYALKDRTIIVGGDSYCPPFEYINSNGDPDGYNVELTNELSRITGLKFKIQLSEWSKAREALKDGKIDMIHSMYYSQERDEVFEFSKAHSEYSHSVFFHKKSKMPKSLNDLMGRTAVVMNGDIIHDKLKMKKGFDSLIIVPTEKEALKIVNRLPNSFAVTTTFTGIYWIEQMNLHTIRRSKLVLHRSDPSYAVLPENKDLLLAINTGIQALKENGKIEELQQKWFEDYKSLNYNKITKIVTFLFLFLIFLIIIIVLWNRKLKAEVEKRIQKIQELLKFTNDDPNPILKLEKNGRVIFANSAAEPILKYWKTSINEFIPSQWIELIDQTYKNGRECWEEISYKKRIYSMILKPIDLQESVVVYGLDITDKKKTEEHLRQVEKLQVIGELAGGIAHDFNNQLAIILGNAEMLLDDESSDPKTRRSISNIIKVAKRSGELTSQLLAYARKGNYQKSDINIHQMIDEIVNMLQHTFSRKITIDKKLNAEIFHIEGDPPQIYSAIMNISINARDAMDKGGEIFVETCNEKITKKMNLFNGDKLTPGYYLQIKVSDTGIGIEKDILDKIFEPFFTTKELGKGTGMGLSAVQGIITMHGGFIDVQTELGKGTTFIIYFPIKKDNNDTKSINDDKDIISKNSFNGTILLVDDEPLILELGEIMLKSFGFNVFTAENGEIALNLFKKKSEDVDIIIMDIIMPVKGGDEIFGDLKKIKPNVKIIIASGYSQKDNAAIIGMSDGFIRKPFSKEKLFEVLRKIVN